MLPATADEAQLVTEPPTEPMADRAALLRSAHASLRQGLRLDVRSVQDALEQLDGPAAR